MVGMLTEAQNTPQPGSGPGPQTPPAGGPGAGTPPPGSAGGPGQPPQANVPFEQLRDEAIQRLYGENFDNMIEMFQANGPEEFAKSMGLTINSAIEFLEKQHGRIAPEQAAEVGMDLMMKLLEDIIGGGVMPDVTLEQVQQVLPATLVMYADSRPDVSKEDVQNLVREVQRSVAEQEGGTNQAPSSAQPGPNAPLSTGPGPEPSGSPVPPGVTV